MIRGEIAAAGNSGNYWPTKIPILPPVPSQRIFHHCQDPHHCAAAAGGFGTDGRKVLAPNEEARSTRFVACVKKSVAQIDGIIFELWKGVSRGKACLGIVAPARAGKDHHQLIRIHRNAVPVARVLSVEW